MIVPRRSGCLEHAGFLPYGNITPLLFLRSYGVYLGHPSRESDQATLRLQDRDGIGADFRDFVAFVHDRGQASRLIPKVRIPESFRFPPKPPGLALDCFDFGADSVGDEWISRVGRGRGIATPANGRALHLAADGVAAWKHAAVIEMLRAPLATRGIVEAKR